MKKPKNFPQFTHFASIPFIRKQHRQTLGYIQDRIHQIFKQYKLQHTLNRSNTNLMHITLSMLTLNLEQNRIKTKEVITGLQKQVLQILKGTTFTLGDIKYFTKYNKHTKKSNVSLFYFDFIKDQNMQKLQKVTDLLIKQMIKADIIDPNELKSMHLKYEHKIGRYVNDQYHMTLYRIQDLQENQVFEQIFSKIQQLKNEKQKIKLTFECDCVDISTRFHYDQSKFYEPLARIVL